MEKFYTNTVVIGAGVVGLAIAKVISGKNNDVIIIEKESKIGQITSSRNSGVIHAGIYYQSHTLKSKLCVEGNRLLYEYAKNLKSSNVEVVIAGAGGAAHLPGMVASLTHIPVLGVPIKSKDLRGLDSLLSIVQMPAGIPLPTLAIGKAGAINAGLAAAAILGIKHSEIRKKLISFRASQTKSVKKTPTND